MPKVHKLGRSGKLDYIASATSVATIFGMVVNTRLAVGVKQSLPVLTTMPSTSSSVLPSAHTYTNQQVEHDVMLLWSRLHHAAQLVCHCVIVASYCILPCKGQLANPMLLATNYTILCHIMLYCIAISDVLVIRHHIAFHTHSLGNIMLCCIPCRPLCSCLTLNSN